MLSLANNNLTFQLSLPTVPSTSSSVTSSSTSTVSPSTSPVSTSPPTAFVPTTASKIARKKKGVTLARARKFNTLQATSNKEEEEEEDGVDEDRESFQDSFPVGSFPNRSRLLHLRFLYLKALPFHNNHSNNCVTFRAWDFAGQDLYQTTHRFFLSRRAIYLLVFNLVNKETSKIEYWLQSLCTGMKDCPIIMVGTHLDDERCTKKYIPATFGLKQRFAAFQSNILDYVAVSTTTYKGVKSLQSKIAAAAARCRFVGQRVPSSYVLLAKRMETIAASRSKANKPPILKKPDFEVFPQLELAKANELSSFLFQRTSR